MIRKHKPVEDRSKLSDSDGALWLHKLVNVNSARREILNGTWSGLVWPQNVPNVPKEFPVTFQFTSGTEKVITGEMAFKSFDSRRGVVMNYFVGGFQNDSELSFAYTKKEDHVIGWGSIYLTISNDAQQIVGEILGLSSHTSEHFFSKLLLLKGKKDALKTHSILGNKKPTIFIGHGRDVAWLKIQRFLEGKGFKVESFESGAHAGKSITDILNAMAGISSFALLIMTGEDKTEDGYIRARQNVVHEIGLFQATLGWTRTIILLENGVEDFSNIHGTIYIPFAKGNIQRTYKQILATIEREFPSHKKARPKSIGRG